MMRSIVRKLMLPAVAVLGLAPAGVGPLMPAGPAVLPLAQTYRHLLPDLVAAVNGN
jgi:hypothetical protein